MAINYKNILLKDNHGNPLLPITLSYYVEYKEGIDVRSYLDTLSHDVDNVNSYIDTINAAIADQGQVSQNIINSVNQILTAYVQRPDHTAQIAFDNEADGLSSTLSSLEANGVSYVTAQQAIEALDSKLDYTYTYLNTVDGRLSTAEGKITALETSTESLGNRLTTAENSITYNTTNITTLTDSVEDIQDAIFNSEGRLEIPAERVTFSGTGEILSSSYNVKDALDTLDTKLNTIVLSVEDVLSYAGVTSVTGGEGLIVTGTGDGPAKQNAVGIGLNLETNGKIITDPTTGKLTVDESKLDLTGVTTYASNIEGKIQTSQIEGGLDANNINITYSYIGSDDTVHNDGEKSVQDFYNETNTYITNITNDVEQLKSSYAVTLTPEDNSSYAKVYTLNQGGIEIGKINIPKDQFLKDVKYESYDNSYALVFEWMYGDDDELSGAPFTYIPISNFIDAITGEIAGDVTELQTSVSSLETRVNTLENASYITGVTLDDNSFTPDSNGVVNLKSSISYYYGTSTDGISDSFLSMHGISVPQV